MAHTQLLLYEAADGVVIGFAGNRRFTGGIDCAMVPYAVSEADAAKHFRVGFVRYQSQDKEAGRAAELHSEVPLEDAGDVWLTLSMYRILMAWTTLRLSHTCVLYAPHCSAEPCDGGKHAGGGCVLVV